MLNTANVETFKNELKRLVRAFERGIVEFKGSGYVEAQLRDDFLNPFWRALGWDLENAAGLIQTKREVEVESRTEIGGRQKRADYLFRTDGCDRFICEAKKPSEELNARYAFQAKRYAWNKSLPLAVLTDFEEFKIYIVGGRPYIVEPLAGLWKTWHYSELPRVAQDVWNLLSRDTTAAGSIDQLVESLPKASVAKGKARQQGLIKPDRSRALDAEFLNVLDEARRELGFDLIRNNDRADLLEDNKLNEAVQRIIDRILFLRICEDRNIDTGVLLDSIVQTWGRNFHKEDVVRAHQRPLELREEPPAGFGSSGLRAPKDSLWRAIVRHFRALDRRPLSHVPFFNGNLFKPHFSEELVVGDGWLAGFIADLSDEESPYLFSYIPVEILGTIYERFLGKVVRPQGRGVTIEEKPEVRKAGGVYYTPRYIVQYIVAQTVEQLLHDAKPEASLKLHFLDPACGSGSFLLRVFEAVCEHWEQWLTNRPEERKKKWCWVDAKSGDVHLTMSLKRQILTSNVFGVDLDPGAVEVTQLSLYLKMLENENRNTINRQRELLPDDDDPLLPSLENNIKCGNSIIASDFSMIPEDLVRVRSFDWEVGFRDIMKGGGFDAVVGNPPYILLQTLDERSVFEYLSENYRSARYKIDTYQVFMERALQLTKAGGGFGFITPNSFLRNKHAVELRILILEKAEVTSLRVFFYPVFHGASVDTCILVARKAANPSTANEIEVIRTESPEKGLSQRLAQQKWIEHPQKNFFLPGGDLTDEILDKIRAKSFPLGQIATAYFGIQTFDREKFVSEKKVLKAHKPVVDGANIQRCDLLPGKEFVDFRPSSIKSGGNPAVYEGNRIGVRQIGRTPIATMIPAGIYSLNTIYNVFFTKPTSFRLEFILGLLLSDTYRWIWLQQFYDQKETFPKVKKDALLSIPVPHLDLAEAGDKALHDRLVGLVNKLLVVTPKLRLSRSESERQSLQNAASAADQQIGALVYELYGLTEKEIKLVEDHS